MQLPKYKFVEKKSIKYCQYMECNREYYGRPIQKYCDFHTDPHNRKRIRPKAEGPQIKNQVFIHKFKSRTKIEFSCALDGCEKLFKVEVFPKQYVYPKYCAKHRSEYQRDFFKRSQGMKLAS